MFETEAEVYEAMGLTPPEPGAAEDTPEDEVDVMPEPEGAAGDEEQEPQTAQDAPDGDGGGDGAQPPSPAEDPFAEQRAAMAQQHEQAMEALRRENKARLDAMAAGLGLRDPYNGNAAITTHEQLTAYQQRSARERLKAGGLSDEQLQQALKELPEVQEAEAAKAEAQRQQEQQRRQAAQQRLNEDVAAIGALCPEIRSTGDLVAHASYPQVRQILQNNPNMGVLDAFRLANFDALTTRQSAAAAQRARNQSASKRHLTATRSRGVGDGLSREQEAMYRKLLPGASREEIVKFHQENMKGV